MFEREWTPPQWGSIDPRQLQYRYPPVFDPAPWPWQQMPSIRPTYSYPVEAYAARRPGTIADPMPPYAVDYTQFAYPIQQFDLARVLRIKDIIDDGDPPPFWWHIREMFEKEAILELYRVRQEALVKLRTAQMDYMQTVSKIQAELNAIEADIMHQHMRK